MTDMSQTRSWGKGAILAAMALSFLTLDSARAQSAPPRAPALNPFTLKPITLVAPPAPPMLVPAPILILAVPTLAPLATPLVAAASGPPPLIDSMAPGGALPPPPLPPGQSGFTGASPPPPPPMAVVGPG